MLVLQVRQVWRIEGKGAVTVDVQMIAATDENLNAAMQSGAMRQPFRYRFGAVLTLPPLRERKDDIPLLVFYFLDKYASVSGSRTRSVSHRALRRLSEWDWPGNVRTLEQVV